jgi:DNA-binding SARP family transcriptional activator
MSHLTLSTFGTLRVALDGTPITSFATDKVRALLVFLAVEATYPHRRETLAHLLWPDLPDRDARHNLSQALWHLRQALAERDSATPLLLMSRDTVQFNPRRSLSVDVTEFTRLLSACDTCTATTLATCAVCLPRLQQAAALYQGDFLAHLTLGDDSPFDEWALHWRERLHQQALRLFGTLADLAEQRGDDEEARAFLTRQLALEPWREEAHRALMRLLARRGERSAALAQYATCRRVLADELGIEPAPETTQMYEQIRDMPALPDAPAPLRLPTPTTAFLGRARELADLAARLTDPACRVLTLLGPGGIGKTRLALQTAADLAPHPAFPGGVVWVPLAPVAAAEHHHLPRQRRERGEVVPLLIRRHWCAPQPQARRRCRRVEARMSHPRRHVNAVAAPQRDGTRAQRADQQPLQNREPLGGVRMHVQRQPARIARQRDIHQRPRAAGITTGSVYRHSNAARFRVAHCRVAR